MDDKRLCCCIPDQNNLDNRCKNLAVYTIYSLSNPSPDNYTESCAEHLEQMLDDSTNFEIVRIVQ